VGAREKSAVTNHDKVFFVSFLSVLGVLVGITTAIVIAARSITSAEELTPQQIARIEERIKPVGQANTDANAAMAVAAAPAAGAARAPMSADQVVTQVCAGCHGALPNAPKPGDKAAWSARGNLAQLLASAKKGKNAMPPSGGRPDLSDAELEAAIKKMSGL
jgi:cytochrome c5